MREPNTLAELGGLHRTRPAAEQDVPAVAAWYERKATVLDHLAMQGSPTAAVQAAAARRHATRLTEGVAA